VAMAWRRGDLKNGQSKLGSGDEEKKTPTRRPQSNTGCCMKRS
jgi:hypothetical protein